MHADPLIDRLSRCYTGAVWDVLRDHGMTDSVLPHDLRPLDPKLSFAGRAFPVLGRPSPQATPHETLLAWTGLLSAVPSGAVLVIAGNDDTRALMGELSAETLHSRGVRGVVTDGGCRDCAFILDTAFPVVCRFRTPRDIVGAWLPVGLGVPVKIGSVDIAPGDCILSDIDGTVVVPSAHADALIAEVEAKMHSESRVRNAIRAGMDPQQAYLQHGVF